MEEADPRELRLPPSPIPRPGERVCWYAQERPMAGIVQGHDVQGRAVVLDSFGLFHRRAFEEIRLEEPLSRSPPNWNDLPSEGRILRPDPATLGLFRALLKQRIPPGPSCRELAREIWSRGFEVFLVGGSVRDLLAGGTAQDIDLATTMPIDWMLGFVEAMYSTRSVDARRGHLRVGGSPASGEPFIDVNMFVAADPGSDDATFGTGFDRDLAHRDFACNALYFDPENEIIVDPSGHGAADCERRILRLVRGPHDRNQMAQIFVRAVKLMARGFSPDADTRDRLLEVYRPMLAEMKSEARLFYFEFQVLGKLRTRESRRSAVDRYKSALDGIGCGEDWQRYFAGVEERL